MRRLATLALVVAAAPWIATAQGLTITNVALNVAVIGQPYQAVLMETAGDPGPIVWSFVPANSQPFGFVIGQGPAGQPATTGTFCYGSFNANGPPTCNGNVITPPNVYKVTIQAASLSTGKTASVQYTLAVVNPLQIESTSVPPAVANQPYVAQIQTSGGTGQFLWSLTAGSLPPGIGLDVATGLLSGTAPGVNAAYTFTLQVLDQVTGFKALQAFTLNVVGGLTILTTSLPDATVNQPYTPIQLQASGSPILVWSVQAGWQLPPGLGLTPGGVLSGTGLSIGQYEFVIQVANPQILGLVATQKFTMFVTLGPLSIKEPTLPTATQNTPYFFSLTPLGGIPPYTWSFDVPNSQGLSIGADTGVISGTPTKAGVLILPVTLKDSVGKAFSISYALNVGAAVSITTTFLTNGPAGLPYSDTLTATGGVLTYSWSVISGTLPPGLTLKTTNSIGIISGTPTTEGVFPFTVQVLDFVGGTAKKDFTITIGPVLAVATTSLPDGALGGVQYSQTLTATNGTPQFTWSIASGALPPGLQLNGVSGVISGTPTTAGNFTFDVQVTDSKQAVAHRNLSIKIPLLILTGSLSGIALASFSEPPLSVAGGKAPYTWSSGPLPAGLQLNSATGVIGGTPLAGGTTQVAFTVTDVNGLTGTKIITIVILQPPAPPTSISVGTTTQPTIGLTLGAAYPSEITGFLTLKFTPLSGAVSTEVRFAPSGGGSLEYVVHPNATQATFPTVSTGTPAIITGTVAGTITVTASMFAGGQDITPTPAPTRTITIDPAVPVISSVALQQVTGGLNVVVTGYSNTREVSTGSFTFTVSSGNTLSQPQLTVTLTNAYATWYNNAASNATGGQFKLTVPFSVTGNASAVTKVAVTLTNSKGTSASVSSP